MTNVKKLGREVFQETEEDDDDQIGTNFVMASRETKNDQYWDLTK